MWMSAAVAALCVRLRLDAPTTARREDAMLDRRQSPRLRSLKGGRIRFNPHWPTIDCVVRNLSRAGARIEMAGEFNTTIEFELTYLQDSETRTCRQIWRQGNRIGVAFV
jgi:hypothetical protein